MLTDSEIIRLIKSGELKVKNLPEDWEQNVQPNAYQPTIEAIIDSAGKELVAVNGYYELQEKQTYTIFHREEFFSERAVPARIYVRSSVQRRGMLIPGFLNTITETSEKIVVPVVPHFNTRIPLKETVLQLAFPSAQTYRIEDAIEQELVRVSPLSCSEATIYLHIDPDTVLKAKQADEWIYLGKSYSGAGLRPFFEKGMFSEAKDGDFYLAATKEHVEISMNAVAILSGALFAPSGIYFGTNFIGIVDTGFKGKLTLGFDTAAVPYVNRINENSPVGFLTISGVTGKVSEPYGADNKYQGSEQILV